MITLEIVCITACAILLLAGLIVVLFGPLK